MCNQYCDGCSVMWGVFRTVGILWVRWRISWLPWGIFSTVGDIMIHAEGYHEYHGGVQYRGNLLLFECLHSTETHTVLKISPTVLKISPQYSRYPPWYCKPPTVLKISPTFIIISTMVLNIPHGTQDMPHSTHDIPPRYWTHIIQGESVVPILATDL